MRSYNTHVRRLLSSLVIASFAISLRASVPSVNSSAARLNRSAQLKFESMMQGRSALEITAASAGISFYEEFYPVTLDRREQPKTGVLHWMGSLIKKGRQKIAELSPQKFF